MVKPRRNFVHKCLSDNKSIGELELKEQIHAYDKLIASYSRAEEEKRLQNKQYSYYKERKEDTLWHKKQAARTL